MGNKQVKMNIKSYKTWVDRERDGEKERMCECVFLCYGRFGKLAGHYLP